MSNERKTPGETLSKYVRISRYLIAHPHVDKHNPTPELLRLGFPTPEQISPNLTNYRDLEETDGYEDEAFNFFNMKTGLTDAIRLDLGAITDHPTAKKWTDYLGNIVTALDIQTEFEDKSTNPSDRTGILFRSSIEIFLYDNYRSMARLLKDPNDLLHQEKRAGINKLAYITASGLLIPFGNETLISMLEKNDKQVSPTDSFEFLTLPIVLAKNGLMGIAVADNEDAYAKEYPRLFGDIGFDTFDTVISASLPRSQSVALSFGELDKFEQKLGKNVIGIINGIKRKQEQIRSALTNHKDPSHISLVRSWSEVVGLAREQGITLLLPTGFTEFTSQIAAYRRLLSCGDIYQSDICTQAALDFELLTIENQQLIVPLALESVRTFFDFDQESDPIDLKQFKQASNELRIPKNRSNNFTLPPGFASDLGFTDPNFMHIYFNRTNNKLMTFEFSYEEVGVDSERMVLNVSINADKGTLDWSVLNNPDEKNPDVQKLKNACFAFALKSLTEVKKQISSSANLDLPEQTEIEVTASVKEKDKSTYNADEVDEIYALRKIARKSVATDEPIAETVAVETTAKVKPVIVMPDDAEWAILTAGYTPRNAQILRNKLTEYNTTGAGDVRRIASEELRDKGFDFRMRVNLKQDTARVILQTEQDENGQTVFKVLEILRRSRAYS